MSPDSAHEPEEVVPPQAAQHFEEGEEAPPRGARIMAVVRWFLVLAMAGSAVLSILYVYGHAGHAEKHSASEYYCPMHPAVVQDQPGDCPICGMALVARTPDPVEPHAPDAASPVRGLVPVDITESRLSLIGMRTAQVVTGTLPTELRAVGYVAPTESGLALIQTRFAGWIEELLVAETGQPVQRGQLLARVYSPELLAAQQELLQARRWSSAAPGAKDGAELGKSARARLELMGMAAGEIDEVEKSGTAHRLIEIRSPVRGYVAQKSALPGLYIQPGTRLFDIADLSRVWVLVELSERDAGRIKPGQRATLSLTAYPGESFVGKVQLVYPTLDPATRSQRARIEFKNADLRLRPGMFGNVSIEEAAQRALLVPREAVVDTGEQQYVFVREAQGRFSPRLVQLGARFGDLAQVSVGLEEGETVVTTGNFLIDSESRLRAALAGSAPRSHGDANAHDGALKE